MRVVAGFKAPPTLKRGGRNDQVSIVVGMTVAAGMRPKIGRAIQDSISNGQDQGLMTEDSETGQLRRRALLFVAPTDFIACHGGKREWAVLLGVRQGDFEA